MSLRISLLGPAQFSRNGESLSLPGYRPLALLAYLLISGKPQSREHLIDLLFDRPDDPRAALRWTLTQLRKSIGSEYITADRHNIAFNFEGDYWLDVDDFTAGDLDLYHGQLLDGLDLHDANLFDSWLLAEREWLRATYQSGLERRLQEQQEVGAAEAVEKTAVTLLELDNMREDWHRALIDAYAQQGKFEAAHAQYELCRQILSDELGSEPSPETVALIRTIRQQQADLLQAVAVHAPSAFSSRSQAGRYIIIDQPRDLSAGSTLAEKKNGRSWNRKIAFGFMGLVLFLIVAVLSFTSFQGAARGESEETALVQPFAGKTVTIIGIFDDKHKELFDRSLTPFEQESGIDIQIGGYQDDFQTALLSQIASGVTPDIVSFPQPGFLRELVRQGDIVDVRSFLDEGYLDQQYGKALVDATIMDGQMAGVWYGNSMKSLVWYSKKAFNEAGYEVPQTWDELIALSNQIVADGKTPWCIGMESGQATGWVGTDWVEDILLRTAPLETYDAWVSGELPFDSPEIRRVFAIMGEIWLNENYVLGGRDAILSEDFAAVYDHLFADPPQCLMIKQASFIDSFFPEGVTFGEDYDFFYLPPIDSQYGKPMLIGGDIMAMFNDRPEVRAVMRHLTTAESVRYLVQGGALVSPHRDAPFEWYSDPAKLKIAQIFFDADAYRFDGSDMMPPEVGTGSFWQGMVEWVEGRDLDTLLREIDASWPANDGS